MNGGRAGKCTFSFPPFQIFEIYQSENNPLTVVSVSDFSAVEVLSLSRVETISQMIYFVFLVNLYARKELSWIQTCSRSVITADCYVLPVACWMSIGQFLFHMYVNIVRMFESWYELSSHNFPLVWEAGDFWVRKRTTTVSRLRFPLAVTLFWASRCSLSIQ